eukprot:3906649-Prymnesium_polylepis.1
MAALRKLELEPSHLIEKNMAPNNINAVRITEVISVWAENKVKAKDVGVEDDRAWVLEKPPPESSLKLVAAWMRRYINVQRSKQYLEMLPQDWTTRLAGRKAAVAAVGAAIREANFKAGR